MLVVVNQFVTLYKSCDVSETVIQLKQQQIRRVADNSVQLKIIFFFYLQFSGWEEIVHPPSSQRPQLAWQTTV